MKLRNKKTGEITDLSKNGFIKSDNDDHIIVYQEGTLKYYAYNSLAELNEEWEVYEPKGPLIKDKKIRKVVRAWAEVNNAYDISYDEGEDCIYVPYGSDNTDTNVCITFDNYNVFKGLEHRKLYTIDELCGEEKE